MTEGSARAEEARRTPLAKIILKGRIVLRVSVALPVLWVGVPLVVSLIPGAWDNLGLVTGLIIVLWPLLFFYVLLHLMWTGWYLGWFVVRVRFPDDLVLVAMRPTGAGNSLVPFGWELKGERAWWVKLFWALGRPPSAPDLEAGVNEFFNRVTITVTGEGVRFWVGRHGTLAAFIPRDAIEGVTLEEYRTPRAVSFAVVTPKGKCDKVQLHVLRGMSRWGTKKYQDRVVADIRAALDLVPSK